MKNDMYTESKPWSKDSPASEPVKRKMTPEEFKAYMAVNWKKRWRVAAK